MEKINRYDCGNGDGMFDDDTGYWVTYEDYKSLLDKYEDLVSKNESLHIVRKSFTEQQMDNAYDKGFKDGYNKMYDNVC